MPISCAVGGVHGHAARQQLVADLLTVVLHGHAGEASESANSVVVVGEPLGQLEPAGRVVGLHAVARELGRDLGPQLLAARELDLEVERPDRDPAGAPGTQAHLDPLVLRVEERHVLEQVGREVGVELAVEHVQDVAVELGGHAVRVVVGRLQRVDVLDQVGAEQEVVAGGEEPGERAQEAPAGAGREVADRAAEEGDHARAAGHRSRDRAQVALEVADDAVDREPVVLLGQRAGALAHGLLGDVERHVAPQGSGAFHRVEQHARLGRRARAELDELGHRGAARRSASA